MATTELASPAMWSPCHSVSGRNDFIYPPEYVEVEFYELRFYGDLRSSASGLGTSKRKEGDVVLLLPPLPDEGIELL
jgi:hypothetical protein